MEPHMKPRDRTLFYKYLDAASTYLEYGSGGSTVQASLRPRLQKIVSVESDPEWHAKVKGLVSPSSSIRFLQVPMGTLPNTWGYPGKESTIDQWTPYSRAVRSLDFSPEFVLIDGRFRVACCLHCYDAVDDACRIAFDDFLDRPQYHAVLDYYEVVEQTEDKSMVILKKKPGASPPATLLAQYEAVAG